MKKMEKSLAELYAIDLLGVLIMERVDGDFLGELIEQYSTKRVPFYGVLDLIKKMEMQYDAWDYPQTSSRDRSFRKRQKYVYPDRRGKKDFVDEVRTLTKHSILEERGKLATFFVHTKFRQHCTWQGEVYVGGKEKAFSFQSVLALLKIMERECPRE